MSKADATATAQPQPIADRLVEAARDCPFCGAALSKDSAGSRSTRHVASFRCPDCSRADTTVVVQDETISDNAAATLANTTGKLGWGLSSYRLQSAIRPEDGLGTWVVERVASHVFEIHYNGPWTDDDRLGVANRIQQQADHIDYELPESREVVTIIDSRWGGKDTDYDNTGGDSSDEQDDEEPDARPDGGVARPRQELAAIAHQDFAGTEGRTTRAVEEKMSVAPIGRGEFEVVKLESNKVYQVDLAEGTCSCPDPVTRKGILCKHMRRVAIETWIQSHGPTGAA